MKVSGPSGSTATGASGAARSDTGEGFRQLLDVSPAARPAPAAGVAPTSATSAVSALLALQGQGEGDLRRQALKKGRRLLDALDRLQADILGAGPTLANLGQLRAALAETRDPTGDSGLDETLGWAEVRAAVEVAKLERAIV
ncbi:MAG: flagellar assembly protein FliX [Hyphomonadaceae bacterium]